MPTPVPLRRLASVARKEVLHVSRDPLALLAALLIPIFKLLMLGYAIDTSVRHIRTVVLDQAKTQESRSLLQRFRNTEDFNIIGEVTSDVELHRALVADVARVGIKIPEDYSRRIQAGETSRVLILIDGSEWSVAAEALNVGNAVTQAESLDRSLGGNLSPIESRPSILFNPDTRSANFFLPSLMVILMQMTAVMLSAMAVVREKESGTLEQLYMTPVTSIEVILGKLIPYLVLTFVTFATTAILMCTVFAVPIHGSLTTLLALTLPFVLAMLGLGLWVSTWASTRDAAFQVVLGTVVPSIFLSGYVFPLDSMPRFFQYVAYMIPATWLISASRGVILRGAGWPELWVHGLVLWGMAIILITMSVLKFHRQPK